jgi:hypothetical protein
MLVSGDFVGYEVVVAMAERGGERGGSRRKKNKKEEADLIQIKKNNNTRGSF